MANRPYRQQIRAQKTAETHQRILGAAQQLLTSGKAFNMESVARRAGVSRVTVYSQFGDRGRLREAVYDRLADSGGLRAIPTAFAAADPVDAILRLAEIFCHFYATHRQVLRRLNGFAALAAGAGERPPGRNQRRRHILTLLVARLSKAPGYNPMDPQLITGQLYALTSFEFYDQLASSKSGAGPCDTLADLIRSFLTSDRRR